MIGRALTAVLVLLAGKMPSLEDAYTRHGPAIVGVRAGDVSATGFFVTSSGLFATVMPADTAEVRVALADGTERAATRITADDSGLALYVVMRQADELFSALALDVPTRGAKPAARALPTWIMGIAFVDGRASPMLGGVRKRNADRFDFDLPCDPGAPVLVDDRVVAVVTKRLGKTSSAGVDVSRLLALASQVRQAPTVHEAPAQ